MGENGGGAVLYICFIHWHPYHDGRSGHWSTGRHSPGYAAEQVAVESKRSRHWQLAGWLGMLTGCLELPLLQDGRSITGLKRREAHSMVPQPSKSGGYSLACCHRRVS